MMPKLCRWLPLLVLLCWLPPASAQDAGPPLSRVVFGSCAHQDRPVPIWERIVAEKPELFLFIGDNIYGDTDDMELLRKKYAVLGASAGFQQLRQICPLLATWDDHDYGVNDAGANYAKKAESQQEFFDFFREPIDSPRRKQEGIYHAKMFGPPDRRVQVILLDTRYFRGPLKKRERFIPSEGGYIPNTDPDATMLGETQWKWLEEQLRQPARLRLLVSSVQVVAEDHGHEKWANMPLERERLFKLLKDTGANGVVVLSGDRHLAELSVMDAGIGYPLYDLTSSGLNQGNKRYRKLETNRHRVGTMNEGDNYGVVRIDWDAAEPRVALEIHDDEGEVVLRQKVPLARLRPGFLKGGTVAAAPSSAKFDNGDPLTAESIAARLDKEVVIDMQVASTGKTSNGAMVFLNSSADRRSPDNFTVVIDRDGQAKLKEAGIADAQEHFKGKSVRVRGTLSKFREQPQVMVKDAAQIEVRTP